MGGRRLGRQAASISLAAAGGWTTTSWQARQAYFGLEAPTYAPRRPRGAAPDRGGLWAHTRARSTRRTPPPARPPPGPSLCGWRCSSISRPSPASAPERDWRCARPASRSSPTFPPGWARLWDAGPDQREERTGSGIRYARFALGACGRFAAHGRLAMTNNAAQRAIRPLAVGRKNYRFAGLVPAAPAPP